MTIVQQGSEAGKPDPRKASAGRCANSNERPVANDIEMAGLPPPPPLPQRWVPHRKAEIVAAVRGGFLSFDEALERYALSVEEYLTWQRGIDLFGLAGLRVNNTQQRRRVRTRAAGH